MDQQQLVVMGLAGLAALAFGWAFVIPYLDGDVKGEARQKKLAAPTNRGAAQKAQRGRSVADTLKEIDQRKDGKVRLTLEDKIAMAGLDWTRSKYYMISAVLAVLAGVAGFIFGNVFIAVGALFAGAFGLPAWILTFLKNRRMKKFLLELPNAVDVIVRGIRSGLPLGDCIGIISREAAEPVKGEFRQILEAQSLGLSLPEAVATLYKRVPSQEANFFSIVVEIQSKSGGNLSEVLGNLSKVLRERRNMRGKVQAMSMEAKASAAIIAALPFIVAILVYMSSPQYISLLWQTDTGKMTMMVSGFWMAIGVFVMKKMITFDI